ncbi:MAG TPA: YebC/PmpR family DNA-binding transcriptional regulator [Candidatus Parcubacteria bacterium]|nr:YebC/PmpR family DNA-binding transcriptional regulator [Candidatus Parcubacteria bacterium]
MSGHSHFHSIKHKKQLEDKKRGKIFSKISRVITIAAREGGGNPDTNSKLRLAIEQAKSFNMPKDNIERAIKRGTGEISGEKLEEFTFDAYGPGGIALIIEGITTNKNRTLSEVRQILSQVNGKLANEGSVRWLFERKGVVAVEFGQEQDKLSKDDIELMAIDAGAEDIRWRDGNVMDIYTKIEDLEKVKNNLEEKLKVESSSLEWVPKEEINVNEEDRRLCQKLFDLLDENDDVQEIYSNLKD